MNKALEIEEKLKDIKGQLSPFKTLLEKMGRESERPFNAIKDGYYETALTNVGSIIEDVLKDVWRKEKISGIPLKKTIEQLTSVIKKKIEIDRLVDDYISDIQKVRNRAAHGEKVLIDDCVETLRRLPTILEWYSKKYVEDNRFVDTFLCHNCSQRVQKDWKNCPFCGIKLKREELVCPFCGKEIKKDWKVCPHCGKTPTSKVETIQEKKQTADFLEGKRFGKYEVRNIIGRGAMGIIFKVWDNIEEEFKAIKIVPHAIIFDHLSYNNLKREVKAASKVSHPNVVKVMSLEHAEGAYFIVMEYIEGETLAQKLSESKHEKLEENDVIDYILQAAQGLKEAHKRGVVHLDLKPQNMMVTKEGEVKVLDFSISYQMTKAMTALTGDYFSTGTLPYMAPEQLSKKFGKINDQTDIWGLGATMYHLLAGEVPFENRDQIISEDEKIFEIKGISKLTKDFIMKCLERNRKYRHKNMEEVISELLTIKEWNSTKDMDTLKAEELPVNWSFANHEDDSKAGEKQVHPADVSFNLEDTVRQAAEDEEEQYLNYLRAKVAAAEGKSIKDADISENIQKAISQLQKLEDKIKSKKGKPDEEKKTPPKREANRLLDKDIVKKVTLRTEYQSVSHPEAQAIVRKRGFFDSKWNKKGEFINQFELKNISGDEVVIDHRTGLMWHQWGSVNRVSFKEAQQWINQLNKREFGGFCDWRLPTLEEATSLLTEKTGTDHMYIDPIFSKEQGWVYTGDKEKGVSPWIVNFINGNISRDFLNSSYVRPVRTLDLK